MSRPTREADYLVGGVATIGGTAFAVATAITVWATLAERGWDAVALFNLFGLTLIVAALVAGVCLLVAGIPLTLLLAPMHAESGFLYALVGAVSGALIFPLLLFVATPIPHRYLIDQVPEMAIGGISGLIGGTIWWLTARRGVQYRRETQR